MRNVFWGAAIVIWGSCIGGDSKPYPTVEAFCDGKAAEECQQVAKCPVSKDACVLKRKSDCLQKTQSIPASRQYSPDFGDRCVKKTHDVYAQNIITPSALKELADVCERAFQGSVDKLGVCQDSYECSGDFICDKGRCAAPLLKKIGELCGNPGETCDPMTSFCLQQAGLYQCLARRQMGETCSDVPCVSTLRCDTLCKEKLKAADVCGSDDDCPTDAPYCDPAVGMKCDAGLIFAPGAATCKDFGG